MQKRKIVTGSLALALSLGMIGPNMAFASEEGELPPTLDLVSDSEIDVPTLEGLGLDKSSNTLGEEDKIELLPEEGETNAPISEETSTDNKEDTGDDVVSTNDTVDEIDNEKLPDEGKGEEEGKTVDGSALENQIKAVEDKIAAGEYNEESVASAKQAIAKARELLASGNYSEVEIAASIADVQLAGEGLVAKAAGESGNTDPVEPVAPTKPEGEDSKKHEGDLKPKDTEGKQHQEWVDDKYVDSNKIPAKSLEELRNDPNAVELKNSNIPELKNEKATGTKKGYNVVNAQTGGDVGFTLATVLGTISAAFASRKKK